MDNMQIGPLIVSSVGFFGLLALLPFIILYLIRPKPRKIEVPSLMFFLTARRISRQSSFLRRIIRDWLFLIQLAILLGLIFQLFQPITKYMHDVTSDNTVLVIDVSASMQVREGTKTRFEDAVSRAYSMIGRKNTIILAKSTPQILLQSGSSAEARDILNQLKPMATPSAIGEAIILAGEILSGAEGRVIVLSDFINTEGIDPQTAKVILESKGIVADFVQVGNYNKDNTGVIEAEIDNDNIVVFIRNYNDLQKSVDVKLGDDSYHLDIEPQSTETLTLKTPQKGIGQITLTPLDDFPLDNTVYVSSPEKNKIRILLISNNASIFLSNALTSSPEVELQVSVPPIVSKDEYDIYVVHDADPNQVLPGTFEEIKERVKKGASLIIHTQDGAKSLNYQDMLPVKLGDIANSAFVQVEQVNRFTKDVQFGIVEKFFFAEPKPTSVVIASASKSPIISLMQFGAGKIIYYGIMEKASGFKLAPDYPVFWVRLVEFLAEQENIQNLNVKAGQTSILNEITTIKTPTRTLKQNAVLFEEQGIYKYNEREVASNLLNSFESDINLREKKEAIAANIKLKPVREEREFSFEIPLLLFVVIVLLLEIIYIKIRGDI